MKFFNVYILFLLITFPALSQTSQTKMHSFSGTLVLTLDGGITTGKTDYKKSRLGGRLTGGVEYYLPTSSASIFGIRSYFGGQKIYSEETNKIISIMNIDNYHAPDLIVTDIYLTGADLIYSYSIKDKMFPYISAGLSNLWFSPKLENGSRAFRNSNNEYKRQAIAYDFRGGFRYQFNNNISMNISGSLHFVNSDNLDDISTGKNKDFYATFTTGLSISLFGYTDSDNDGIPDNEDMCPNTPEGIEVDENGCPKDSDRDGVPDYLDKCPDTQRGITVDNNGCPIDSDGDGVPDHIDLCPNTPKDLEVDEHGCPIDSDNDGVFDYLDKCPDTPEDIEVNKVGCPDSDGDGIYDNEDKCPDVPGPPSNNGCPDTIESSNLSSAPQEILIEGELTFFPGTADIRKDSNKELDKIVKLLQMYPDSYWRIEGHTDSYDARNVLIRPLSLRRAEAILNYFVSKGLPSYQFQVYDMGDKFPIANNNTEYGRMKNRRVVIIRED